MARGRAGSVPRAGTRASGGEGAREELASRLRAAGLRATAARVAILASLAARPHAGAEAVIDDIRRELGTVSAQAVYHALGSLAAAGLVRRIEPAGSPALYERRVGDNHHHVVCRGCGAVADVDCAVGHRPCLTPSDTNGYLLDEAEVTYWGLCPACQRRTAPARGRRAPRGAAPAAVAHRRREDETSKRRGTSQRGSGRR